MSIGIDSVTAQVSGTSWTRRVARRVLAVPLVGKLIGANIVVVAAAMLMHALAFSGDGGVGLTTFVIALSAALLVNLFLVQLALRPIDELKELAERVSSGEFDARGTPSPFADEDLSRLGETINGLLDALAAERRRIQDLGAQVVRAQDLERARMSRELHDSIAQTLAAVRFQLAAAGREGDAGELRNRLAAANGMISAAMDEVVNVSYSLHSRVAEDLGLEAALDTLSRQMHARSGMEVTVAVTPVSVVLPGNISATLFRVAEEALRDVEMRGPGGSATVNVMSRNRTVRMEVTRPDRGDEETLTYTPGLASVKDRVLLAGGKMSIDTTPNGGHRVTVELNTLKAAS